MAHRVAAATAATLVSLTGCSSDLSSNDASSTARPGSSTSATLPAVTTVAGSVAQSPAFTQPPPRVLLIGDSTLLAVEHYHAFRGFSGFEYHYDAESCRTLGIPSCGDPPVPPNSVAAIRAAPGEFDTVVVMAGYDEWWTSFPSSFDEVVDAARAKAARHIVWLTYPEDVGYELPSGTRANEAFMKNNDTLHDKVATGRYPDVQLAEWDSYTTTTRGWITRDGVHLTPTGALGVADYISRWIAHLDGLPCAMPRQQGDVIEPVCPNPDSQPPITDVAALYEA